MWNSRQNHLSYIIVQIVYTIMAFTSFSAIELRNKMSFEMVLQ